MYEDDLFRSLYHKVSTGIERTFDHPRELSLGLSCQNTLATSQHDGEPTNINISLDDGFASSILDSDYYRGGVGDIPEATFVWGDFLVDSGHFITIGKPDVDVGVFEPKTRVDVRSDFMVCFNDVLNVDVDEVVERIDVLFDETLDLQEGG